MGQLVLADDDLGVDADFAGASENFDDASAGGQAALRKAQQLNVDNGAIELVKMRDAAAAQAALVGAAEADFLGKPGSEFLARGNFDVVLHAGVVGNDEVGPGTRRVVEQTHYGGLRAVEHAKDAALGARAAGTRQDLHGDVITVHGVFDCVAGDEDIAVELRRRGVEDDEAVAVV